MVDSSGRPPQGAVFGVVLGFAAGVLATTLVSGGHDSGPARTASLSAGAAPTGPADPGYASTGPGGSGSGAATAGGAAPTEATDTGEGGTTAVGAPVPPVTGGRVTTHAGATAPARTSTPSSHAGSTKKKTVTTPTGAAASTVGGPAGVTTGVTPTAITIGVAYPDLTALKTLGPEFDAGDVPAQYDAWKKGAHAAGLLPIDGRDVNFVFATYNVTDTTDQDNACRTLTEDDHAFAVIGAAYFEEGDSCVAQTEKTPLITTDGPSDAAMAAGAPNLYSLSVSDSKMLRNMVAWAAGRGALKGKKIGVYYANDAVDTSEAQTQVIDVLKRDGFDVAATDSTGQTLGGPEDGVAVQKFSSAGVDLAILLTSETGFQQQANTLGYKPTFIDSDHNFGTSDVATSTYNSDEYDGTYAITGTIHGEAAAGMPISAGAKACVDNYEKQEGTTVTRPGPGGHTSAEYSYILNSCDLTTVMITALQRAGKNLGQTSFVNAIRTIDKLPMVDYTPVTYTSRPDGGTLQRTVQWLKSCTCWHAIGSFAPFPVP